MRRAAAWGLAVALVAGAWAVTVLAPSDNAGADAFTMRTTVGERVEGRNIAATVLDVRAARSIVSESGWRADGTWLLVDLSADAGVSQSQGLLTTATLRIGERTFSASERGPDEMSIYREQLVPGVPMTGSLLFELPDDALVGHGTLRFATSTKPWGDSIVELDIDLDALHVTPEITVADTGWAR
ncbi:MAG: hypothetical protein J7484_14605 [Microbacterium sp.]|nr:hypothetical protein [Microbacterium sp.]